jgi:branched-subunit amino acid ABC-type transport system permease component
MLLFVVASGLVLVYGVMGELNLAHGSLYLAGTYVAYALSTGSLTALLVALVAGLLLGAGGGVALAAALRPLTGTGRHLEQAMATLGVSFLLADAATSIVGATPLPVTTPTALSGVIDLGRHGYPSYRLAFIAVGVVVAVGLHRVVRATTAGIMLRAVVADPGMAAATGVATTRVRLVAYAAGGALATGGGVLGAPLLGPAPGVDSGMLVLSLIIVILGGAGSIPATLAAALLVGQVQTLGVIAVPLLGPFALFLVVLLVLVGRRSPVAGRLA